VSSIKPLKLIISYIKEENIITEFINLEKLEKQQHTEGVLLENEFISPSYYTTSLNSKSKDFKSKKSFPFVKIILEPNFFFSNTNGTTFCIANKNDKEIRISHSGQRGHQVKINLDMELKILKPNSSFTYFLACDG